MDEDELNAPPAPGTTKRFFLFEVDGELYATSVEDVERVMKIPPITPVPNAPRAIIGIFHLRGQVVVVFDLISRMNMPKNRPLTANFLFVLLYKKNRYAILVDRPKSIVEIGINEIHAPDPIISAHVPAQYIEGVFMYQDVFAPKKKRKSIMLGPAGVEQGERSEPLVVKRPVLWLNIDKLLDQQDLAGMFTTSGEQAK